MVISADFPDALVAEIDKLITRNVRPDWPFSTPTVVSDPMHPSDRRKLDAYLAALAAWKVGRSSRTALKNRSMVLRKIVAEYFRLTTK